VSKLRFEAVRRGQQKDREIERLKKASKWISVDERLPDEDGWVIVSGGLDSFAASYLDGKFYYANGVNCGSREVFYVTHWQPLPDPPKV
jgi:hypothetical protein